MVHDTSLRCIFMQLATDKGNVLQFPSILSGGRCFMVFYCFCSQQSKQYTPRKLLWNLKITLLKSCEEEKSSKPSLASPLEGWQDAVTYKDSNSFLDFALAAPSEITASVELNKHSK